MVLLAHVRPMESAKRVWRFGARYAVPHIALARFSRHALLAGTASGSEYPPWKEKILPWKEKIFHGKKKSLPWRKIVPWHS